MTRARSLLAAAAMAAAPLALAFASDPRVMDPRPVKGMPSLRGFSWRRRERPNEPARPTPKEIRRAKSKAASKARTAQRMRAKGKR